MRIFTLVMRPVENSSTGNASWCRGLKKAGIAMIHELRMRDSSTREIQASAECNHDTSHHDRVKMHRTYREIQASAECNHDTSHHDRVKMHRTYLSSSHLEREQEKKRKRKSECLSLSHTQHALLWKKKIFTSQTSSHTTDHMLTTYPSLMLIDDDISRQPSEPCRLSSIRLCSLISLTESNRSRQPARHPSILYCLEQC